MNIIKNIVVAVIYFFAGLPLLFFPVPNRTGTDKSKWAVIKLPEGADTTSEYWKGIDLEPKPPVFPLTIAEEKEKFLLPPGYSLDVVLTEPKIESLPPSLSTAMDECMYWSYVLICLLQIRRERLSR